MTAREDGRGRMIEGEWHVRLLDAQRRHVRGCAEQHGRRGGPRAAPERVALAHEVERDRGRNGRVARVLRMRRDVLAHPVRRNQRTAHTV